MTLAEGIETKELREALETVEWIAGEESDSLFCTSCGSFKRNGHDNDCDLSCALSRPKSSYEQEAELMENEIRMGRLWDEVSSTADFDEAIKIHILWKAAREALDEFRGRKTPTSESKP